MLKRKKNEYNSWHRNAFWIFKYICDSIQQQKSCIFLWKKRVSEKVVLMLAFSLFIHDRENKKICMTAFMYTLSHIFLMFTNN